MLPKELSEHEALRNYLNGSVDLIFRRRSDDGTEVYSVLDWKSDSLDTVDWNLLKKHTDDRYSIQRVLYSYCLVRWLAKLYRESEADTFNKRFGGIYYAYLRTCKEGTSNGIYAQTWNSWADLETAFTSLCDGLIASGK